MQARLFVGNLSWNVTDADLTDFAAPHGEVLDAKVIVDRDTGRSRGFGFVTVETENVQDVIRALDGQELQGRAVRVNEAEARPQREGGFGGGGGGRGGYGGGGSGGRGGYGGGGDRGGYGGGGGRRDRDRY
jgi:RNA recognition motif-containing protein